MSDTLTKVDRDTVQELYFTIHGFCSDNSDIANTERKLQEFVIILIATTVLSTKFNHKIFVDLLHSNIEIDKEWKADLAFQGFYNLEKLLLKLYRDPWRKELKTIKVI